MIALTDKSAAHSLVHEELVACKRLQTQEIDGFKVMVADGFTITCTRMIPQLSIQLGNYKVKDNSYVVSIGDTYAVLELE